MLKHWKRWLTMFVVGWIAGAATVTTVIAQYNVEDFSLPDLVPMFTMLAVGGALGTTVLMPILLWLGRVRRQESGARKIWRVLTLLSPLLSALLFSVVVGAITGVRSLGFDSLPVGEAVSFTGAFTMMGLAAG